MVDGENADGTMAGGLKRESADDTMIGGEFARLPTTRRLKATTMRITNDREQFDKS